MSRRTVQIPSPMDGPSLAVGDPDATADLQSLPTWQRVLILALTYDPAGDAAKGAGTSKYCRKD